MVREKINVMIHDQEEVSPGVFKTKITHPKLDGELSFIHGTNNREQTLEILKNSIVEDINEIIKTFNSLVGTSIK